MAKTLRKTLPKDFEALLEVHLRSGHPLPDADLAVVASIVHALPRSPDLDELARLGVEWLLLNPSPTNLATPIYRR